MRRRTVRIRKPSFYPLNYGAYISDFRFRAARYPESLPSYNFIGKWILLSLFAETSPTGLSATACRRLSCIRKEHNKCDCNVTREFVKITNCDITRQFGRGKRATAGRGGRRYHHWRARLGYNYWPRPAVPRLRCRTYF